MSSDEICEALTRHAEILGCEAFEKAFVLNGRTLSTVWCVVGPNAERFAQMAREWMEDNGFRLDGQ